MNHSKRFIAIMLTVGILVCCFASTAAFAAAAKWNIVENVAESIMDKAVEAVPEIADSPVVPTIDKNSSDDQAAYESAPAEAPVVEPVNDYNATQDSVVDDSALYYYDTTPWYYIPTVLGYAASSQTRGSADYAQGLMDVAFVIPSNMIGTFSGALQRNLAATALDYADDGVASARTIDEFISTVPVVGALYQATGDFGKLAVYSTALTGINASNTALVLVVQGVVNIAIVVMIPITAAALPFLTVEDGGVILQRVVAELENLHNIYNNF